jgi:hypothetical protein
MEDGAMLWEAPGGSVTTFYAIDQLDGAMTE